jgi:Asp-tRNA(Asn)/Glu-tRNA(Gln) amidotransferase A subunit family amidase
MEVNPEARDIAAQLDLERKQSKLRGYVENSNSVLSAGWYADSRKRPLHGLPILLKGNIGTKDRMQTNGELALYFTKPHSANANDKQLDLMHSRMQSYLQTQQWLSSSGSKAW